MYAVNTITQFAWIAGMELTIGIVITQKKEKRKAYIGFAEFETPGDSAVQIVNWGKRFDLQAADILMKEKNVSLNIPVPRIVIGE